MMKYRLTYRTAFVLALTISGLLNLVFSLMFLHFRNSVIPGEIEHENWPIPMPIAVKYLIFSIIFTFVYSFVLYVVNFKLLSMELRPNTSRFLRIVSTFIVAFVLFYMFLNINAFNPKPLTPACVLIAFYILLHSQLKYLSNKQQQTALENKTLIAENMRTRYEALKNQVDPHFLFNSLNTLNTLIKLDADKAQQYVQQLSYVFRYTLQNKEIISLEEELKFTQAYCHLMQIRYGDCLRFEYQINPRYHNYNVIPLSLQTLVENAIKHNMFSTKQPLIVCLTTSDNDTISVSNPIQPKKEQEKGEGVGLANLSERYRLMWQREIVITQNDGIFKVEIHLSKNINH